MIISFEHLNLLEKTKKTLVELGFINPTPIQNLVIPVMIEGHDIIAQSQTGTGKTFSFGIPIIEKNDSKLSKIQSLILCPTRELALQVFNEVKKLLKYHKDIRATVIYGGESYNKQFRSLDEKPHIVIATPGRMVDILNRNKIDLSFVKILTLDEADEMLKMGFQESLEIILKSIPTERQTVLFSATIPDSIKKMASKYQKNPRILKVENSNIAVEAIKQFYFLVNDFDKNKLLVRILDQKNPDSVIIFGNTKKDVDNIFSYLQERDFLVDVIHGDLKQNQRQYVMNNFRKKNIKILVATDVAARGLDISDIKMVINYDLPHENEVYIHRIGRTGRAGKEGIAYSFISYKKINQLKKLEYYSRHKMTFLRIPTVEEVYTEQNNLFKNNIVSWIEKYDLEKSKDDKNNNYLTELLLTKFDSKQIINGLLEHIMPHNKKYENISEVKVRNHSYNLINNRYPNSNRESNNNRSYNKDNFNKKNRNYNKKFMTELIINLGKEDGLKPSLFLKILNDKFNIYSYNVGNIEHFSNKTVFELPSNLAQQIKIKKNVYFENKLLHIQQNNK
ncbi:DEAD/DEAH box helicase [Candidatus Phytoplasma pini]|uniref:Dead/DEAH box helicase n=1 Tax=Candidatus Phytoplasma pini TaxID=267362 RepID=A0A559KJS3_9MOLU|nr:DEAD/DEAH box helicase [Candidatus Phytoplasma pini]TVY12384.1 Dead/DEAH box helicase [Candidatus Phytoplasma pini]